MSNRLLPGAFAPNFKAIAYGGTVIDTHLMRGRKIWVLFYRYSTCPLCCMHLSSVVKNEEKIQARNIALLVIFESPIGKVTSSVCGHSSAHFPMIADPQKKLYELYGTETRWTAIFRPTVVAAWLKAQFSGYKQGPMEGALGQVPASFLIDERGAVRVAYYGKTIADHIPWKTVEKFSEAPSTFTLKTRSKLKIVGEPQTVASSASEDATEVVLNPTKSVLIEALGAEIEVLRSPQAASMGIKDRVEKTVTDIWKKFGGR